MGRFFLENGSLLEMRKLSMAADRLVRQKFPRFYKVKRFY